MCALTAGARPRESDGYTRLRRLTGQSDGGTVNDDRGVQAARRAGHRSGECRVQRPVCEVRSPLNDVTAKQAKSIASARAASSASRGSAECPRSVPETAAERDNTFRSAWSTNRRRCGGTTRTRCAPPRTAPPRRHTEPDEFTEQGVLADVEVPGAGPEASVGRCCDRDGSGRTAQAPVAPGSSPSRSSRARRAR